LDPTQNLLEIDVVIETAVAGRNYRADLPR
jgi:hypothetical protein